MNSLSSTCKVLTQSSAQRLLGRCIRNRIVHKIPANRYYVCSRRNLDKPSIKVNFLSTSSATNMKDSVKITFLDANGVSHVVDAKLGKNLLDVAHENDIDLEGACGGELACSTCHLVFEKDVYDKLPEKDDEEDDMLDLAWGLTETSRLGCQIKVTPELSGITVRIPDDNL